MTTVLRREPLPYATNIVVSDDTLTVDLSDGRTISVPLGWYPRLVDGEDAERKKWILIGRGEGIRWPALDEDINIEGILAGWPSGESQDSLRRWLKERHQA